MGLTDAHDPDGNLDCVRVRLKPSNSSARLGHFHSETVEVTLNSQDRILLWPSGGGASTATGRSPQERGISPKTLLISLNDLLLLLHMVWFGVWCVGGESTELKFEVRGFSVGSCETERGSPLFGSVNCGTTADHVERERTSRVI